jgi:cysteine desulfurase/selenocysteine lyase
MSVSPAPQPSDEPLDASRWRPLFPITRKLVHLNHAGVSPVSSRVVEAMGRFLDLSARTGILHYAEMEARAEGARAKFARLIGAHVEEIAFIKNTSEGLARVANGLPWKAGDRIVTTNLEYPSNVYPWWHLARRGIDTLLVPHRDGRIRIEDVEAALAPPTRLLAVSSVEFGNGFRNDLETLGRLCRQRGIWFCVDAIQSLGVLELDVERCAIDFLAADAHKWLLCVEGIGGFYVSRRVTADLDPVNVGWKSVVNRSDYFTYDLRFPDSALKYEEGSLNLCSLWGLDAALDLILEVGVPAIQRRVTALIDRLVAGLEERRCRITSPLGPGERSGILCFRSREGGEEAKELVPRLRRAGFITVERAGSVRVSPHFYNDEEDIDRFLEVLSKQESSPS